MAANDAVAPVIRGACHLQAVFNGPPEGGTPNGLFRFRFGTKIDNRPRIAAMAMTTCVMAWASVMGNKPRPM